MSTAGTQSQKPAFPINENTDNEAEKYALSVRLEAETLPPFVRFTNEQKPAPALSSAQQTLYHKNLRAAKYDFAQVKQHTQIFNFELTDAKDIEQLWKQVNSQLQTTNETASVPQTKADWKEYMHANKPSKVDRKTSLRLLDYLAHWLPQRAPDCLVDWAWFTLLSVQLPVSGSELSSVRKVAQIAKEISACESQIGKELLMALVDVVATVFRQSDLKHG